MIGKILTCKESLVNVLLLPRCHLEPSCPSCCDDSLSLAFRLLVCSSQRRASTGGGKKLQETLLTDLLHVEKHFLQRLDNSLNISVTSS